MAGAGVSNSEMSFPEHTIQKEDGARKMNANGAYGNSSFFSSNLYSDFFSGRLPLAICLQSVQGCWPSKVFTTASPSGAS